MWLMRKVQHVSRNEWSKKGKEIDMDLAEGLTEVFERMKELERVKEREFNDGSSRNVKDMRM